MIGYITRGSGAECDELPQAGTRARLILVNFKDVVRMFVSDIGVILSVELRPAKVGYEFLGFRSDVKKSDDVVKRQNSKNRFVHSVGFVVYEVDQPQKLNVSNLVKGRFLAIVENNGKDENSIEVLGRECGVAIVDGQIRNAHETNGFFTINLSTPSNGVEFERKLPQNLGATYQDGLDIIEELLTGSGMPDGILLNEDGTPILTEDGDYIYL